jgi:SAM-dependent methyltransferase
MPSSRPNTIPTVIHLLRQLKPRSILDVGVGFGKWGHLFREYTDILEAEHDPARYQRQHWQVRIDGIEGFPDYLTPMHHYLYDQIHIGDARVLIRDLPAYDLVFLGDVLEHFDKADGIEFLRRALDRANQAVILTTPKYETEQVDLCGNELERHRSLWAARDFQQFEGALIKTVDRATLLVVLARPGVKQLKLTPPTQPASHTARQLRQTRKQLCELFPLDEAFILVDEEQIRADLPHHRALPFLEKEGLFWGPPPDDATAICELERLRATGARRIVFAWPCYWWLDHFPTFHAYLRKHFHQPVNDSQLVVFDLIDKMD